ncbi:2-(hydroxymethyl)glutarate dehydrogenase [Nymphon striatum]|nr:2-(hydroxymethyl)glutarate dehydrogenase [Nymphon striatum]
MTGPRKRAARAFKLARRGAMSVPAFAAIVVSADACASNGASGTNSGKVFMKVGFVGLGSVGGKLAGSVLRNGFDLAVHDLDEDAVTSFVARGAVDGGSPASLMETCDVVITCLPSPAACAAVVEAMLPNVRAGKIWLEMSTTDADEVQRLAKAVQDVGGMAVDCPVSGGCHRAATGNISIFAGCDRATFDAVLPILTTLGRRVLHTGPVGSASILKVMTNYLATANLLSVCEAMVTMKAAGMDMATTYEAIKISSGTSFVHETESQVILNGSRDIGFSMGLVKKDIGLFQQIAEDHGVPLEISPMMVKIFEEGIERYGFDAQSDDIIKRLEEPTGLSITAPGFPAEMIDGEPEERGYEVTPPR